MNIPFYTNEDLISVRLVACAFTVQQGELCRPGNAKFNYIRHESSY